MDNEIMERFDALEKRMDRMQDELLQDTMHNVQVILENTVNKQLQLLIEGQQTLLQTMAPKSRLEALEEEVILLKEVLRAHSREIAELKKAQ